MTTVLLSVGDLSGDSHAADLVRALGRRCPGIRFTGLGGAEMEKAGVELVAHQRSLAVGGFSELAHRAGPIFSSWRRMSAAVRGGALGLIVLVDSGGFNLPLARLARRRQTAPILYYIAPQVWAWRSGRIRKLARRVDRLALIFPFEPEIYAGSGVRTDYVGHPLVDQLRGALLPPNRAAASRELGLDPARRWIALLPGSRINELRHHLPIQLEVARQLHQQMPDLAFVLALAPNLQPEAAHERIRRAGLPPALRLELRIGQSLAAMRASQVVLVKPGSVTLEATLLARAMVVMGRTSALGAAVARRALQVPSLAMPNLIAGEAIVPEFLQDRARPEAIAAALAELLERPARERQRQRLAKVAQRLGSGGAAERVAAIAEEMLAISGS
ncbi:MAG: lipid-A-disaccharide synthase [Myxococcota bacterium]